MSGIRSLVESHRRATVVSIAAVGLLLHFGFFLAAGDQHQRWDSAQYLAGAHSLAAGHGFTIDGQIEARRTPGYPLFLVPFLAAGLGPVSVVVAQHVIAVALALALFFMTEALTGDALAAAIAELFVAVDSGQIYLANLVMTETLMSVLLVAALFALVRWHATRNPRWAAAGGALVAASVLVRPVAVYLWIPLVLWIALFRPHGRRFAAAALFLACAASLPMLWMWRNSVRAGTASLSSIEGEDLYYWRAAGAVAMHRSGFEYSILPFGGEENFRYQFFRVVQHEFVDAADKAMRARFGARAATLSEAQRSAFAAELARRVFLRYPGALVLVTINGALHLLFDSTWMVPDILFGGFLHDAAIVLLVLSAVASFLLAVTGFLRLQRTNPGLAWLLAVVLVYFVAVSSGPEYEQWRYRVPLIPLEGILVAANVLRLR
ncbi:MAG TPA: glycosyltransferase family 39 protein [Thermoanaerobaculia bacterium]|nr:glycosyltransferase family 39 protein [Thermoanaerobaculia bacterium]